jgi:hypothetical protein
MGDRWSLDGAADGEGENAEERRGRRCAEKEHFNSKGSVDSKDEAWTWNLALSANNAVILLPISFELFEPFELKPILSAHLRTLRSSAPPRSLELPN